MKLDAKNILVALLALAVAAGLLFGARYWQKKLEAGLPPKYVFKTEQEARQAAAKDAFERALYSTHVLNTGSMAPWVPHKREQSPQTAVAVALYETVAFKDIRAGNVLVYMPKWLVGLVMHSVASVESDGLIMSGIANKDSEARWRVEAGDVRGRVVALYTWE